MTNACHLLNDEKLNGQYFIIIGFFLDRIQRFWQRQRVAGLQSFSKSHTYYKRMVVGVMVAGSVVQYIIYQYSSFHFILAPTVRASIIYNTTLIYSILFYLLYQFIYSNTVAISSGWLAVKNVDPFGFIIPATHTFSVGGMRCEARNFCSQWCESSINIWFIKMPIFLLAPIPIPSWYGVFYQISSNIIIIYTI